MSNNVDPYAYQTLLCLEADTLKVLVDAATMALEHKRKQKFMQISKDSETVCGAKRGLHNDEKGDSDEITKKKNRVGLTAAEETNKAAEMLASEAAGNYVLVFGKYKGMPIREVDVSYLTWMLGFKRVGMRFERQASNHNLDWIKENHLVLLDEVRKHLMWRCWVCRSTDVRFPSSRLCVACYLSSK